MSSQDNNDNRPKRKEEEEDDDDDSSDEDYVPGSMHILEKKHCVINVKYSSILTYI